MSRFKFVIASVCLAVIAGCSGCAGMPDEREMNYLASALTKVSAAVDAKVRYGDLPQGLPSDEILTEATKHDPDLMKNFNGRVLRVLVAGEDSAVLLCEAGLGRALLEDAGCTARMDSHRWAVREANSCEFTLNVTALCAN